MADQIEQESFEVEYVEILRGLKNIKKKHNYTRVKILLNDDGSGEIQAYDKTRSVAFSKIKLFKNYDELLGIFQEYAFVK